MRPRSRKNNHGFTMIELLMVIVLTGTLAATALTQYLDFKRDGEIASAVQFINNIKSSLKMALSKARVSCNRDTYPSMNAIITNSLLADNYCTALQLPDAEDRKILTNSMEPPINPFSNLNTIIEVSCPSLCTCNQGNAGYYYNPSTGDIGYPNIGDCAQ